MSNTKRARLALATLAAAVALSLGVAGAQAGGLTQNDGPSPDVITNTTANANDRALFATNDVAYTVPAAVASGAWVNVPGMFRSFTVPPGTTRHLDVSFNAETDCVGGSWCAARVLVVRPDGTAFELYPQSGLDYAFDSPGPSATWQGHALGRNTLSPLSPGTYRVYVQAAKVGAVTTYRIDDMQMRLLTFRP